MSAFGIRFMEGVRDNALFAGPVGSAAGVLVIALGAVLLIALSQAQRAINLFCGDPTDAKHSGLALANDPIQK